VVALPIKRPRTGVGSWGIPDSIIRTGKMHAAYRIYEEKNFEGTSDGFGGRKKLKKKELNEGDGAVLGHRGNVGEKNPQRAT